MEKMKQFHYGNTKRKKTGVVIGGPCSVRSIGEKNYLYNEILKRLLGEKLHA